MRISKIKVIGDSSIWGIYANIRNIADIPPKWKNIRNADMTPNLGYIRSTADITKLYKIWVWDYDILNGYHKKLK